MSAGGSGTKPRAGGPGPKTPATGGATLVGATLGNYRVAGLLGKGGMGAVYLGEHVLIGRKVAIKVLDPSIADEAEPVARFFVEARAVNEIRHPNIVEVTDLGTHQGRPFIVMEYLAGATLEQRLRKQGRLAVDEMVNVTRQMAGALGAAHDRGLVHRDLKPANVMLLDHPDYPDFVKVLDFGIAKLLGAGPLTQHRTETGALLGTPAFMSPEQCLGDLQLDHRSDVYSLGVMMFQMLTGRLPFEGEAVGRLILAHVHEPPPVLTAFAPATPPAVQAVVMRALAKKPADRFGSMRELRRTLEEATGKPRSLTPILEVVAPPRPVPTPLTPPPAVTIVPGGVALPTPAPVVTPSAQTDAATLRALMSDRVRRGALPFVELPEGTRQILDLLRDPSYSVGAVAALIRRDGRLATHVVRRANADGMPGGKGAATNPEQAMGRLGSEWLRTTILELGARRVIDVREPRFEDVFRRPWTHALAGATAAERLARVVGAEAAAADAYLAALLRDAGVSLLLPVVPELERELAGPRRLARPSPVELVVEVVMAHQRTVTLELLRRWQLPDTIGAAIEAGVSLHPGSGWSLRNLVRCAAAFADKEGFYLRREHLADAEVTVESALRDLSLSELRARRVTDKLKEAVKARE